MFVPGLEKCGCQFFFVFEMKMVEGCESCL
jgi:hypothetical protein